MADITPRHQQVICMMGIPGSGKSTWVKKVVKDDDDLWKVVEADAVQNEVGNKDKAFEEFIVQVYQYLNEGYNVVLDAPNPTPARRALLGVIELYENQTGNPVVRSLKVMRPPTILAYERNSSREKPVPEETMHKHYVWFEKGLTEIGIEGWDHINFNYEKEKERYE